MEIYDDAYVAHDRAKHLNTVAGRREYCMTGMVDGKWAVRRFVEIQRSIAYLTWKAAFLEHERQMMCRRFIRTARRARAC
jgi:hypothetical protein